ncbi:hypothetical protein [Mesobacterium pallidum]|uniref:hypothetical protein n=1 Tax=Mesobacterium pallidum TaxID=2872037 RepID=UPI001EE2FDEB|nr:hypothetical protein [Mesobacterium pallidum]
MDSLREQARAALSALQPEILKRQGEDMPENIIRIRIVDQRPGFTAQLAKTVAAVGMADGRTEAAYIENRLRAALEAS